MSDKYIIKNCPVCEFSDWEECTGYLAEGYICNDIHTEIVECKERTDCKLKQIVELCKEQKVINCNIDGKEQVLKAYYHTHLGDKILELLDIQEVE